MTWGYDGLLARRNIYVPKANEVSTALFVCGVWKERHFEIYGESSAGRKWSSRCLLCVGGLVELKNKNDTKFQTVGVAKRPFDKPASLGDNGTWSLFPGVKMEHTTKLYRNVRFAGNDHLHV